MKLGDTEISNIMKSFPHIKLSYENLAHKKVYDSNFMITIPEGKRAFAWFTEYKLKNVLYILEIETERGISSVKIVNACFADNLCYGAGTIIYGTLFFHNHKKIFNIQDIFYYKGKVVDEMNEKLKIYETIFKTGIKQLAYSSNSIFFGLPIMSTNLVELQQKIKLLPYPVKYIQYRYLKGTTCHNIKPQDLNVQSRREVVFKVKAELQNDIYNLYAYSKNMGTNDYFYETALIPDYKTSIMMNKLFRKIKENYNLDALEESDDEEEFENERIDKFVFLEKVQYMLCSYNNKFKKWVPMRLANKDEKLVEITALQ